MAIHLPLAAALFLAAGSPAYQDDSDLIVEGLIRLVEQIDLPAKSEGALKMIRVKEGQLVTQGELLGQLDDESAQLSLQRAETDQQLAAEKAQSETAMQVARLTRDVSHAEFERAKQVKQNSPTSISAREFDRLRLDAEKAELELTRLSEERRFAFLTAKMKAIEVKLARLALNELRCISPLDGVIVQIHKREGEWVRPGDKLIRVVRLDHLRVEAFINLKYRHAIPEATAAVFQIEGPDQNLHEFPGAVVFINPEADPVNGQLKIWAEIENQQLALRPGQRGRLKIVLKKRTAQKPELPDAPVAK